MTTKVEDIKVATTIMVPGDNDISEASPRCVKWYFLVQEINGKYYEIFSHKQIEKQSEVHKGGHECSRKTGFF